MKRAEKCDKCGGSGRLLCPVCCGTGKNSYFEPQEVSCRYCNGRGYAVCPHCCGDGVARWEDVRAE